VPNSRRGIQLSLFQAVAPLGHQPTSAPVTLTCEPAWFGSNNPSRLAGNYPQPQPAETSGSQVPIHLPRKDDWFCWPEAWVSVNNLAPRLFAPSIFHSLA